ncbi:MAG: restriction endonuclease subunit S [Gallionella sp.]|nr:restriction endonuclease subunit S [Gallionella sp.]
MADLSTGTRLEVREAPASYRVMLDPLRIRPGYKQTVVGMIPEDWEVKLLGDCLIGRPDYGINAPSVPFSGRLPAYIRITDITDDGRFSHENLVSVNSAESPNYYLDEGDIVFARTGASVGKTYRYNLSDGPLVFAGFLIRIRPDQKKLLSSYAAAYITTDFYWSWVRLMSMRSGQPGINGNEYSQLPIPTPPLSEQRAIATALSDVDALIASLDKLIAKKRDLKQGAMQQLLTGQRRLPGFSGEWEVKRLGDVCPLQRGFDLLTSRLRQGCYPVVYSNGVMNYHDEFIVKGPGVVTGRSGTIGNVHFVEEDFWPHNTSLWVTSFKGNYPKFIFYLLGSLGLERFGTGSGVPTLNRNDVHTHRVQIPPTSEEQTAIAAVLSDMDAEIAALEARRDKTRALKQGMMQEMLTGRIRLV